ncbi:MAG: tol-pal system-associated acyl-CoA thioesterase [Geminicoccaceae bacterium]
MSTAHLLPVRVYYEDTDAGGIVYHARYLAFAERARTELLRSLGVEQRQLRDEVDGVFAVRRAVTEFLRPARLDDALFVETRLRYLRGARLGLLQNITRDGQVLVSLDIEVVFISSDMRPRRLPPWLAARFAEAGYSVAGEA